MPQRTANQYLLDLVEDLRVMNRFELITGGKERDDEMQPPVN